jgi:beta-mannosidase
MSEFGFQSLPPLATIRTYAHEQDWDLGSAVMVHHQRCENGNSLMAAQMADGYRMPKDFPSMVYMTMVLQAEGIRYGVEHWRRNKHRVSGTLYWQLNDCWPVASWSSIDYFGRWKALHYAARRFYAPVLLSIQDDPNERGGCMSVYVTSDLRQPWQGELTWKLARLDGEVLDTRRHSVLLDPQESRLVCALDFEVAEEKRPDVVFICELIREGHPIQRSLATFVPNKDLALADPRLESHVTVENGELAIELRSRSLARFVEVALEGADVVVSDNYFDVFPGDPVQIRCRLPEGWSLEQARLSLQVRSLAEAAEGQAQEG